MASMRSVSTPRTLASRRGRAAPPANDPIPGKVSMAELSLLERTLLFYGTRLPNHPRKWWLHDRLRRMSGVAVDQDIEVVRDGLRWLLNPSDFEHAGLFWLGSKDPWDLYHLRRLAGPGCVFFDIGANFGYYSLALAAALDRQCRVYAFEPNPKTYARLLRHI